MEKTDKNILLVSARSLTRHGAQTSILNIVKASPPGYCFTWYCPGKEDPAFGEEVRRAGVTVVTGGMDLFHTDQRTQYRAAARDIRRLCREKKYDAIHVNTGILKFQAVTLLTAMLCGVPRRIAHSHNSIPTANAGALGRLKQLVLKQTVFLTATKLAACSHEAARALFGEKKNVLVILNRIDTERLAFSREKREKMRKELALEGHLVLGHVGVINRQKNHRFLLEVFREVAARNSRARLLLVGDGSLEQEIRRQTEQYGLEQRVIFTGYTDRVSEYLCAMDLFVLPSLYEGMPLSAIEAQTSGLPCVVSDRVTPEVAVTEHITFLPLGGVKLWADKLLAIGPMSDAQRADAWMAVRSAGYDAKDLEKYVKMLYE